MPAKYKLAIILFIFLLTSCCLSEAKKIYITDAKTAIGIDEKLMPLTPTTVFPKETSAVFCWFQWKNAQINNLIVAKWYYVTDDIPVLDYTFKIPRKEGSGSVSLVMPENKPLPSGEYKIDLIFKKHSLKSLTFKIQ